MTSCLWLSVRLSSCLSLLQMAGGGLVPLSHAICCRPCLPSELPNPSPLPPTIAALSPEGSDLHNDLPSTSEASLAPYLGRIRGSAVKASRSASGRVERSSSGAALTRQAGNFTDTGSLSGGLVPVAIISIGCHPSSGRSFRALECEEDGASFVTGEP